MGEEKRKSERLEGRFRVAVREKMASWVTRTEDVSARGCRIELKRPLNPGMLVQLVFDMGPGAEPLVAHAQVAWARKTAPWSAGLTFLTVPRQAKDDGKRTDWIDRLLSAYVRRLDEAPPGNPATAAAPVAPSPTPAPTGQAVVGRIRPATVIVPPVASGA